MDSLVQKAIQKSIELKKHDVPWENDAPHAQGYFQFDSAAQSWVPRSPGAVPPDASSAAGPPTTLALFSWNIDFMLPFAQARMDAALAHLEELTARLPPTTAAVIFLQECVESDLATISQKAWVREKFHVTDLDTTSWGSAYYGTTTLVDRRLPVRLVFRAHFAETRMERDAFFVDVLVGRTSAVVRLGNVHLESLALEPPFRPAQVQLAADHMRAAGVHGALLAGDFNAIQPFDRTLHADNGLRDAYLELGGAEDTDEAYTWGQQAPTDQRQRFGCSRMDKVLFCGGLELRKFARFGAGVEVGDAEQRKQLVALGFDKPWITDHLGVSAEFDVVE